MSHRTALAGRIRASLRDVSKTVQRANQLTGKAHQTGDSDYWDGVALNLHHFYTGIEHILEDIGRTMDGSIPSGPEWHRDLLLQMSGDIDGVRPAILSLSTRECLDEYRGFRHIVRNVYAFNLRSSRVEELVQGLASCYESVSRDLISFAGFLENT